MGLDSEPFPVSAHYGSNVIYAVDTNLSTQPRLECILYNVQYKPIIDTGSSYSLISYQIACKHKIPVLHSNEKSPNLKGISGKNLTINGICKNTKIMIENKDFYVDLIVISGVNSDLFLLGSDFLMKYGFLLNYKEKSATVPKIQNTTEVFTDRCYEIRPFSTELIFGHTKNDCKFLSNQISCCNLDFCEVLHYDGKIVYNVKNNTNSPVTLDQNQIIALGRATNYEPKIDLSINKVLSAKERANVVFKHLNIDTRSDLSSTHKGQIFRIFLENNNVFSISEMEVGNVQNFEHEIKIRDENELLKGNRTYAVPLKLLDAAKHEIERLLKLGVLIPSRSRFSQPTFFVPKAGLVKDKNGKLVQRLRLVTDFRYANRLIVPELAAIPNMTELLTTFNANNSSIYTVIDLQDGFYSLKLHQNSQDYTNFVLPNIGSYKYKKVPMGCANSPASMTYCLQRCLAGTNNCLCYVDDVIIYAKSMDEMINSVKEVITKLRQHGFKINYKKMVFAKPEVKFLGFLISKEGIRPLQDKIDVITKLTPPATKKACQAVIGSINHYRKFVRNFSEVVKPLIDCIKSKKDESGKILPFKLTDEGKLAFEKVKSLLQSASILKLPCPEKKFYIFSDASQFAIGSSLMQFYEPDTFHPIAYYSKSLNPSQKNYPAFVRELYAIYCSIKFWRFYLEGGEFEIRTDSEILSKPKFITKTQIRCVLNWVLELTERYHFKIVYMKPNSVHLISDMLSRIVHRQVHNPPSNSVEWKEWFEKTFTVENDSEQINAVMTNPRLVEVGTGTEDDPIDNILDIHSNMLEEQLKCEKLSYLISSLESKPDQNLTASDLPDMLRDYTRVYHFLTISRSNLLCIKIFDDLKEKFELKIVVPKHNIDKILYDHHCHPTSGHMGFKKTLEKIKHTFWFPQMSKITELYIESCGICAKNNTKHNVIAKIKHWEDGSTPGNAIAIDIFETARVSVSNKYIISIIDRFSRHLTFEIMQNSRANTIARVLLRYFMTHGIPNVLLSDLGRNLQGKVISELLALLKIERLRTAPFSPNTNGSSERSFRSIKLLLRKFVSENPKKFPDYLKMLQYSINTSVNSTTKLTPFEITFGYQPRSISSLYYGITSTKFYETRAQYRWEQFKHLEKIYEFARRNIKLCESQVADSWNKKSKYVKFFAGQKIWYYNPVPNIEHRKIRSPFIKGVILKVYPADVYLIKLIGTGRKLMSSYRRLSSIPFHTQQDNPSVQPEIDDWEGPQFSDDESESSDSESEKSDGSQDHSSHSEESEFQSADDQTPEAPIRRSARTTKGVPPVRFQGEDWRKD